MADLTTLRRGHKKIQDMRKESRLGFKLIETTLNRVEGLFCDRKKWKDFYRRFDEWNTGASDVVQHTFPESKSYYWEISRKDSKWTFWLMHESSTCHGYTPKDVNKMMDGSVVLPGMSNVAAMLFSSHLDNLFEEIRALFPEVEEVMYDYIDAADM